MTIFDATICAEGARISARDLIPYNPEDLRLHLPRRLQLVFDDGEVLSVTGKKTYITGYFWLIYREYPETPLLAKHHLESVLQGEPLNAESPRTLAERIVRSVEDHYQLSRPEDRERLNRYIYRNTCQDVYNFGGAASSRHMAPIGLRDFVGLYDHLEIAKARSELVPHPASINHLYKVIKETVSKDKSLSKNYLVKALKAKIVNIDQICQAIGARGFPTEVDGKIFRIPIIGNYLEGLSTLYDFAAGSRDAPKALYNAEAPLQDTQYFARRLQLLTMTVESISEKPCENPRYIDWPVKAPIKDEKGGVIYPGDLHFMAGKYYLDPASGQLKEITGDDPTLYHKTLKLRSVLGCSDPNPHAVCPVCFGRLARNVSRFANIGHLAAATMTQQSAQKVLSTKHLVTTGVGAPIILSSTSSKYFELNKLMNNYMLLPQLQTKRPRVVIAQSEAVGLTDIIHIPDLDDIFADRVSSISYVDIITELPSGQDHTEQVELAQGSRRAILTPPMLKYVKEQHTMLGRFALDERNNFIIDLSKWDFTQPAFTLPQVEYSYSEHSREVAKMIESNMQEIADREHPGSPASTLQELFSLVNQKLHVNIVALEVIIYASMIPGVDDYRMARGAPAPILGVADKIIVNRSLGVAYAYEKHATLITSPQSYLPMRRPDSVLDVAIDPRKVVEEYHPDYQ